MNNQPLAQITHNISLSNKKLNNNKLNQNSTEKIYDKPILIDNKYLENSSRLAHILNSVLVMFAYNYSRDIRLQKIYQLDNDLNEILMMAEGTPFEIGMYLPHFWYDESGQAKIEKLNTKNAIQYYLKSSKIKGLAHNSEGNPNCLQEFIDRYDSEDILYIIQQDEDNSVIEALEKLNFKVRLVQPSQFMFIDNKLIVNGELARQFYLNIDREDLKIFDKNILKAIITSGKCINDIRSLILLQDRRTLVAFFNPQIMSSYINQDDYKFLQTFLAPCFNIQTKDDQNLLLTSEQNWTLKLNNPGGKKDIINKMDISSEEWEDSINNQWHLHTVHPDVNKKIFNLTTNDIEIRTEILGFDVFFNGKSYGPGIFETKSESQESLKLIPLLEKES